MVHESYFQLGNELSYLAHSVLRPGLPTLLFIHGIGDSHISFLPYLSTKLATEYNILIPDLLGHGKSSAADDYSFQHQVENISQHLGYLQLKYAIEFSDIILITHSMGGIHGTLLCEKPIKSHIKDFINVEGSVTQYGSFVAYNMVESLQRMNFNVWFDGFKKKIYEGLAEQHPSIRSYFASLDFCQPEAFKQNASEMYNITKASPGKYTNVIGKKFVDLDVRKIFCYGDTIAKESIAFLNENHIETHHFPARTHFILSECREQFVDFVSERIKESIPW